MLLYFFREIIHRSAFRNILNILETYQIPGSDDMHGNSYSKLYNFYLFLQSLHRLDHL